MVTMLALLPAEECPYKHKSKTYAQVALPILAVYRGHGYMACVEEEGTRGWQSAESQARRGHKELAQQEAATNVARMFA